MSKLNFVSLQNNESNFQLLSKLMLPYCKELDNNAHRNTPESTLLNFIRSIVNFANDSDRFIRLCYEGEDLIGFFYGKIDRKEHKGYVRPGWGYVMEFYVKPQHRRNGYGKEMYTELENLFKLNNISRIWLTADPVTGEPFWSSVGFKNSGEKSSENGLYIFEKTIEV